MYNASEQFHTAVYENSPVERVLFEFPDSTIFTNEDIHMVSGLKFMEAVNLEEDLKIGACPASSIETTVMNYHGLLSGYAFGECTVSLAVRTLLTNQAASDASCITVFRYGTEIPLTIEGHLTEPWLTINGAAPSAQPPFPVYSVVTVGDILYCISIDGEVWAGQWTDGALWGDIGVHTWDSISVNQWDDIQGVLVPLVDNTDWAAQNPKIWDDLVTTQWQMFVPLIEFNAFMTNKFKGWSANHRGMSYNAGQLYEFYTDGIVEGFEYVKLGMFQFNKPQKRKVDMIAVQAYDRMTRFDVDAQAFWDGLTYPITLGQMFERLCNYVGVGRATVSFINSTRSFAEAPLKTEGVTAKEVLGWIAEAACSFARMTRDGEVELAWFGEKPVSLPMTSYFSVDIAEYSVAKIDKLQISSSENDIGVIIATGTNGYQIMDNPCLYGNSDAEIRGYGVPIYSRLSAFAAFSPVVAKAVCDWSVQAGDIIAIVLNGVSYGFPVYCQTITWNGAARASYESTGAEKRPVMDKTNRRLFEQNKAYHELTVNVDGIFSRIEDPETGLATLALTTQGLKLAIEDPESGLASLELTTRGLKLATNNNKLSFDANGLTVQGGGLRVKNYYGQDVLYADTLGNLTLAGNIQAQGGIIGGFSIGVDGLRSSALNVLNSGMIEFGSYARLYQAGGVVFFDGITNLNMSAPDIHLGNEATRLNISNETVNIYSLHLYDVPQSPGGNKYLAWNPNTGEVMWSEP